MKTVKMLIICMFLIVTFSPQTLAQGQQDSSEQTLDRSQAAARAQQKVNGRVLRVDQTKSSYRVKVLKSNGRVISVDVDKNTGRVKVAKDKDNS